MSIIASEPLAIQPAEAVDSGRSAFVPAAAFVIVQITLVAETISVMLMKEIDSRNPAATLIAVLLSFALLANLGLVCGIAVSRAAGGVRQSKHSSTGALAYSQEDIGALDRYARVPGYLDVPNDAGESDEVLAYSAISDEFDADNERHMSASGRHRRR